MIRAAWLLLAGEHSKEYEVIISSEQCKNKIKGLKKKWAEYCFDISSTGNNVDKPILEPQARNIFERTDWSEQFSHSTESFDRADRKLQHTRSKWEAHQKRGEVDEEPIAEEAPAHQADMDEL
ncbi:hypothetical protein PF007_g17591 [Phytophthora fragariae]|uniref:Uncharacterized protein n=1 Tax=Phytophthora fragariae TaxID=53985 RepID=A0A6A3REA4_9STRA|nr:hypothetical protein PF003_g20655 [Phytophthora fragariae]KAE9094909.1 hypothetical protein PF007_g17591 [Phytophthora fragariae]KAE9207385.1 hypothetical protein PF004_g17044 [Phytophthora fragariae]